MKMCWQREKNWSTNKHEWKENRQPISNFKHIQQVAARELDTVWGCRTNSRIPLTQSHLLKHVDEHQKVIDNEWMNEYINDCEMKNIIPNYIFVLLCSDKGIRY